MWRERTSTGNDDGNSEIVDPFKDRGDWKLSGVRLVHRCRSRRTI